jgi:hypothetical protein
MIAANKERTMKRQRWLMCAALGLAAWAVIGLGTSQAAVISPVNSTTGQLVAATFTVSIFDPVTGRDITDVWLPEWNPSGGTPVYVVFHDLAGGVLNPSSLTLVTAPSPGAPNGSVHPSFNPLRTSAYPGQCTNYGNPTDLSTDFALNTTPVVFATPTGAGKTGFLLTPLDCGGMAVISATTTAGAHTFILPQSSLGVNPTTGISGIPDIWAAAFCTPTNPCAMGTEDNDSSAGNATPGDGIFAFDEYRGFIVSGVHVRTDPRQKDLFLHLVNPQCVSGDPLASTASLLGGPNAVVFGNPIFSNVDTLISGTQIHRLGYATPNAPHYTTNEWVDRFNRFTVTEGLRFGDGSLTTAPTEDRQINQNVVYFTPDPNNNNKAVVQRGLRFIECVDATTAPSLLGFASLGSPNGPDNAIIFTQRIVNYFTNSLGAVCATPATACLSYSTFQNGAWTAPVAISPLNLFGSAFAFYLAMEIGHTLELTPTVEGGQKVSYGYHHAPGTGSNLDQAITNKVSNKTGNTFYIPQLYNTSDLTNYQVK